MRQGGGAGWPVGRWKVIVTPSTETLNFKQKKGEKERRRRVWGTPEKSHQRNTAGKARGKLRTGEAREAHPSTPSNLRDGSRWAWERESRRLEQRSEG